LSTILILRSSVTGSALLGIGWLYLLSVEALPS